MEGTVVFELVTLLVAPRYPPTCHPSVSWRHARVLDQVDEHYQEMNAKGAQAKGEGRIS